MFVFDWTSIIQCFHYYCRYKDNKQCDLTLWLKRYLINIWGGNKAFYLIWKRICATKLQTVWLHGLSLPQLSQLASPRHVSLLSTYDKTLTGLRQQPWNCCCDWLRLCDARSCCCCCRKLITSGLLSSDWNKHKHSHLFSERNTATNISVDSTTSCLRRKKEPLCQMFSMY